jgi:NitT/TauT family transport system substrate-binding protein
MAESLSYADGHPAEAVAVIGTYTKIAPEVMAKVTLPEWHRDINRDSVETIADLAVADGLLSGPADVNALLP